MKVEIKQEYYIRERSVFASIILVFFFNSLGLFYSTTKGGLIMTLLFWPFTLATLLLNTMIPFIIMAILFYPICFIWGIRACKPKKIYLGNSGNNSTQNDSFTGALNWLLASLFFFLLFYALISQFQV